MLVPLSLLAFFFAISVGVVATSDSVSEEKREGTLGLLFLTDLKGYDVILGKLAAHSMTAFYALVAVTPILGIPLLMGGVTLAQFAKLILALITAIVVSLAAGIFVSTHSRNERKAMVFTFLLLAGVTCLPFLAMVWLENVRGPGSVPLYWKCLVFSPGFAVGMATVGPAPFPAVSYWYGIALSWVGAMGFLLNAARTAPRSWTETGARPSVRLLAFTAKQAARTRQSNRKLLEDNPFFWLAMRGEAGQERVWLFVLSMIGMWLLVFPKFGNFAYDSFVVMPAITILLLGLKIWIAGEACRCFIEDRRNNAMEFLLSTPLTERQIIGGQWRALRSQFLWPMTAVMVLGIVMAVGNARINVAHYEGYELSRMLWTLFYLPVDFIALGWVGMWLGMISKGRGRAMMIALGLVVLLPRIVTEFLTWRSYTVAPRYMMAGSVEGDRTFFLVCTNLLVCVTVTVWARRRLLANFRRLAVAGGASSCRLFGPATLGSVAPGPSLFGSRHGGVGREIGFKIARA